MGLQLCVILTQTVRNSICEWHLTALLSFFKDIWFCWMWTPLIKLVFQSIVLSFLCHSLFFFSFFKNDVLIDFSDHSIHVVYLGFHMLLYFEHWIFLALGKCSPTITRIHGEAKTMWSTREILFSISPIHCVISEQYNLHEASSLSC